MPDSSPPLVRTALLMPLIHHFEEHGGNVDLLLADMQISNAIRTDFDRLIPVKAIYETIDEIATRLGDPFLGATVGRDMARNAMGPVTKHLTREQTVGNLLDRFLISVGSYGNSTNYRLENDGQNATLKMTRKAQPDANPAHPDALTLALLVEQIRPRVGQSWDPKNVLAVVVDETVVPEWLLPRSSLITGSKMGLTLRFPSLWMVLNQAYSPGDTPLGETNKEYGTLAEAVRSFCKEHMSDPKLDITKTARACRLHPKALSRKLSNEDTSFKAILEDQRRQFAIAAIGQGKMTVTEIALRTGFTQASNFTRAYRRWTGEAPSDARSKQR
ncbi:AraC family transcriptional regulator [Ruegeria atlantica]|uniref:Virulence-regulating protein VirS n=1 Tax=Ruegeria atlantica TaxID=81569 RepID=A0A0P1EJ03_9RHOB|nr:AraC family transcriptional regulator [Ruegeria atlantica]CUH42050.1 Virulence-regulating protein VirS [Ruegeria atlantica]